MPLHINLEHTYHALGADFSAEVAPESVSSPTLIQWNQPLAQTLEIQVEASSEDTPKLLAEVFSGQVLTKNMKPIAQAYAGHQFGHLAMLGDGRALLLGEVVTSDAQGQRHRFDLQLKGSGCTPFSRRGDGKAVLGPMLREFVMSEAMYALGIPTTRALALVASGDKVYREQAQPGAVLTRVAQSHVRVGTFEYFAATQKNTALHKLLHYTAQRHFPHLDITLPTLPFAFLREVAQAQASLICHWMRVGFIHGVMNTDNMSIAGETIDYGPCAFMDEYHPDKVFSSIDAMGRYRYAHQPHIAHWNLTRLAESLLPLCEEEADAINAMGEVLADFRQDVQHQIRRMRGEKIGIEIDNGQEKTATNLINDWLSLLANSQSDYTNAHVWLTQKAEQMMIQPAQSISDESLCPALIKDEHAKQWLAQWEKSFTALAPDLKGERLNAMQRANPQVIPRNHRLEQAIRAAEDAGDFTPMQNLISVLATPYQPLSVEHQDFIQPPREEQKVHETFCGT